MVRHAVQREPFWPYAFPANREKNRESAETNQP